jgi:amino acid transporter
MGKIIVLGIFILFGLVEILQSPGETTANFTPLFPRGVGAMFTAMGLTFIAFQGYDLISTVSEEIVEPERNIPRAILIALVMGMFFPIEVVGSAASTLFLLVFAMVNMTLFVLRRKAARIRRRYQVPLYPLTPLAGLLCSIVLAGYQYRCDPRTWYIGLAWIAASLLTYYLFFKDVPLEVRPIQMESTDPLLKSSPPATSWWPRSKKTGKSVKSCCRGPVAPTRSWPPN